MRIMSEEDFGLSAVLKGIERNNRLRIITLIILLFLGKGLKLGQLAPIPNAVFILIGIWLLTVFVLRYIIGKQRFVPIVESIHFRYYIFEVLLLTMIIYFIGSAEALGVILYVFIIFSANTQIPRDKAMIVGIIATLSYITLVLLEYFGLIPHKTLSPFETEHYRNHPYVITRLFASVGALCLITYTCSTIADMLRKNSKEYDQRVIERTEELTESEEKYRNLVEKSLDGIYILQDDVCKFANKRLMEMSGYTELELKNMDFRKLIAPESLELVSERELRRLKREDVPEHYEFVGVKKDGVKINIEIFSTAVTYMGRPAVQAALRDITKRKRLEEEKKAKFEELQKWYKLTVDRELKMVELKKRLKELEDREV